jgi:hypothetical protein
MYGAVTTRTPTPTYHGICPPVVDPTTHENHAHDRNHYYYSPHGTRAMMTHSVTPQVFNYRH